METSSEYTFPIFVSSTDYNLKDFRAELARFLSELGYRPILSSAEGFPDSSPSLEPWESCLPVLDKCFVTILVIDGRYGAPLKWVNYKETFNDKKISPTHAEYIFAHAAKKRMLVFIRKMLMPHYQSYRKVIEANGGDKIKSKAALAPTLPDYVTFETLDFINEVKTTKPIPWINEFEDITSVKKEIQKKMLNELAELFLVKNKHVDTVIDAFNKVMETLSLDEQRKILSRLNSTKEFTEAASRLDELNSELSKTKEELSKANNISEGDRKKSEAKIEKLNKKISDLEAQTQKSNDSQFFIDNGRIKMNNPNSTIFYTGPSNLAYAGTGESLFSTGSLLGVTQKCEGCGKTNPQSMLTSFALTKQFTRCPACNRLLCHDCWPQSGVGIATLGTSAIPLAVSKCPDCSKPKAARKA